MRRWTAISGLTCCQGRTSEAKNDCNKKSTPLAKTTSKQPVLTSRDAARPDIRLRTRFGTPASPSIEHRSTAAAAPRLGRSSKLTPLACSECIAATADGRSSRRVVRRTSCPRCRRAAAQLKFLGERWRRTRPGRKSSPRPPTSGRRAFIGRGILSVVGGGSRLISLVRDALV